MPPRRMTYSEIADDLAARIAAGEYTAEIPLPSYTRIAEIYDVSRSTAQAAVRVLHLRGLVESQRGRAVWPIEQSKGE